MAQKNQTAGKTATKFAAMRVSLGTMRKLGNNRAISKDFMSGNPKINDAESTFRAWSKAIKDIYDVVTPWATGFNDANTADTDLNAIYEAVKPMWVKLTTDIGGKIFCRPEHDVYRLLSFSMKHGITSKGSIDVALGLTSFRKEVETMLGIRLAQGQVLTEDEFLTVTRYDKAEANLEKAVARLKGVDKDNGEHKDGLEDMLKSANAELEKMKTLIKSYGIKDEDIDTNPFIINYVTAVENAEKAVKDCKKKIEDYKKYLEDNKSDYNKAMAKVAEINLDKL